MTVSSTIAKVTTGAGDGVVTVWSFDPLVIFASTDLVVTLVTILTGAETALSEGTGATNYSVTVAKYPGTGSITYPADAVTPMPSTHRLVMRRVLTLDQLTNLQNRGTYFPDTLETQLDKIVMQNIQQQEELDRTLKGPVGFTGTFGEADTPVALKYLRRNTANDGYEHVSISAATAAASDVAPLDVSLSAADAGTAADFAREDHVHLLPTVSIAKGGTGAATAAAARTALGVAALTDAEKSQHDRAFALAAFNFGGI